MCKYMFINEGICVDLNNILLRIRKQVITYLFDPSPIIIHSTVFTHNYTFIEIYSTFWNKYSVNITIIIHCYVNISNSYIKQDVLDD